MDRAPWWRRTLRNDSLLIDCRQLHLDTVFKDKEVDSSFNVEWEKMSFSFETKDDVVGSNRDGLNREDGSNRVYPLLSVDAEDGESCAGANVGSDIPSQRHRQRGNEETTGRRRPGIRVHLVPPSIVDFVEGGRAAGGGGGGGRGGSDDESSSSDEEALDGGFMKKERRRKKKSSPFAEKKVVYENQEMITPGSKEEMKNFVDTTSSSSQVMVELRLPLLSVRRPLVISHAIGVCPSG